MRQWNKAVSVADLGNLMADWLEGRIPKRPGYFGRRPDDETTPLIRTLVAANRAGFLTTDSQPGCDEAGADGQRWRQRAAVHGLIADHALLSTLRDAARRASLTVIVDGPQVVVTERAGRPYTAFAGVTGRRDLRHEWQGVGSAALSEIISAHQVAIIDPAWGPSDRLWTVLDQVAGRYR